MIQLGSDVAICYGIDGTLPERIAQWKAQGYIPHLMTGVSWGEYQDYLYGRFDGVNTSTRRRRTATATSSRTAATSITCRRARATASSSARASSGRWTPAPRRSTSRSPSSGSAAATARASSASGSPITTRTGSRRTTSPDAQYRASMLKYYLYRRALKQVFDFVKAENARTGRHVKCYVPTHSLINYAHWKIVSPESSLIEVGADGFIAQVWTGTARTPNVYRGVRRERTFETAFFEYGAMMNVVQAERRAGLVPQRPDRGQPRPLLGGLPDELGEHPDGLAALAAGLAVRGDALARADLPRQVPASRPEPPRARRAEGPRQPEPQPIPPAYATELMTVITALNDMEQADVSWDCGTRGIGVVVSDTMMFQRGEPSPSDPDLGSFYGLAMPLVKHGMPAEPVQLENAIPGADTKVLLMTYEGMKPMTPDVHAPWPPGSRRAGARLRRRRQRPVQRRAPGGTTPKGCITQPAQHLFEQPRPGKDRRAGEHTGARDGSFTTRAVPPG